MVRLGMEPSLPGGDPGLRDVFSDRYGRGGADHGGLGETRSSPPAESARPSSPFALLEDLDLWLDGWQGAEGATINEGPPLMQEESPPKTGKDPTLDLFQASIRQAQLCVLELQGEIDRQVGSPMSPSQEPLHLATDSEEEEDEKEEEEEEGMPEEQEEEEEEEEEEMECLFYDNPLFQESPGPARNTDSFEDPTPEVQEVRSPPPVPKEILLGWRRHPPTTSASDPSPLLTSLPQSHPLPPLVITEEGDEEEELVLPLKEEEEEKEEEGIKMQAPRCFPPQPDGGLSRGVSKGPATGAHPTGQGLQMQAPRCFPPQPDGGLSGGVSEGPAAGAPPTGQGLQMQAPRCFPPQLDGGLSGGVSEGPATGAHPVGQGFQMQAPRCFPPQPDGGLSGGVSEGPATGAHTAGQGLLFSACSSSLVSTLLQETPEHHPLEERPLPISPPAKETPPYIPPLPLALNAEWGPRRQEPLQRASFRSHPPASCAWAEGPQGASCLREEGSAQDPHPVPLSSPLRKLPGALDRLPTEVPAEEKGAGNKEEEEEGETAAPQHCPQIPPADPTHMDPGSKEPSCNEGPLIANGSSGDRSAALRLATRLHRLDGIKKSQVASFLRKNNEFSRTVAEAYLSFFDFQGKTLDQALRSFLKAFVLTGETQERERILNHFSQRFHSCNPEAFHSPDAVHTLTCAIMLLNTDLHGQKVGKSMSCQAFVANLDGLNDGQNFPKELLKGLYHSIRQEKLEWAADEEEEEKEGHPNGPPTPLLSSQKKINPFLTLLHDPGARTYRQGPLFRKMHAEADGKKTPWGKRGWKSFHTVLKGTVLYFFKDESCVEASEEPIGVHHALAERASRYTKRPHVFRLQTADWRIFLFQAQSTEEMGSWISRINLVAAAFSSPPFPEAVGSQRRFVRPVLPTAPCKSPLEEQYQAHGGCAERAALLLQELQRSLPGEKRSRGRHLEEYLLRKEYLLYEKRRYETYVRLLGARLSRPMSSQDPHDLEAGLEGGPEEEGEEEEGGTPRLQKSHSSPSLNVEGQPATISGRTGTGVKVKRNISERRTVRKILIPRRNKLLL
ncbi:PH and SEC7 domain-containing protein 4 isoform X2 [Anolis sagrei]|uniref:PH and SEC7 domain-containing protein 4 isoform X2 n=1 Tax=Anolis sagrei TaxID=38937 RepID=UPI0035215D89